MSESVCCVFPMTGQGLQLKWLRVAWSTAQHQGSVCANGRAWAPQDPTDRLMPDTYCCSVTPYVMHREAGVCSPWSRKELDTAE